MCIAELVQKCFGKTISVEFYVDYYDGNGNFRVIFKNGKSRMITKEELEEMIE